MSILDHFIKKDRSIDIVNVLKQEVSGKTTLADLVDAFEKICDVSIPGVRKEEEMILFETGTFSFSGQPMFYFSLVRQIQNEEEEYYQLHLEIKYKPSKNNVGFSETVWNEEIDDNIFDYVRNSESYFVLSKEEIAEINVYMDET